MKKTLLLALLCVSAASVQLDAADRGRGKNNPNVYSLAERGKYTTPCDCTRQGRPCDSCGSASRFGCISVTGFGVIVVTAVVFNWDKFVASLTEQQ